MGAEELQWLHQEGHSLKTGRRTNSIIPAQTPGVAGLLDRADPNVVTCFGDTPGPLGINDHTHEKYAK